MDYNFPLIDQYHSVRMDCDLSVIEPGQVTIVETPRRLQCETSWQSIRAYWWMQMLDGRSVISVPPGAGEAIRHILQAMSQTDQFNQSERIDEIREAINGVLAIHGFEPVEQVYSIHACGCNESLLHHHAHGECKPILDTDLPFADWPILSQYYIPGSLAYGVIADGQVVAIAGARPTGILPDRVVDIGVATASAYRHAGYAQTAVAALVDHITRMGGEALYGYRPQNRASAATAHSVGFVEYARFIAMTAPIKVVER